jgi:O-antigen ligase
MVSVTFWHASFGDSMDRIMRIPSLAMPGKNSNLLVSIMPLIALACWRFWMEGKRALASLLIILLAADIGAMTISYNRQAFIALGAGIACAGLLVLRSRFTWRRLMVFLVGLSLVAGLLGFQLARRLGPQESVAQASETVFSQDVRWELWRFSLEKISEQPWTGAGFGRPAFRQAYPEFMPESRDLLWHAHNMVINKGIQMGIPGIVTFLILWFMLVREFVRHLDASPVRHPLAVTGLSLLAAVFVKNMTDDFFVRDMALLFWLLVGILIGSLRRYENSERQPS